MLSVVLAVAPAPVTANASDQAGTTYRDPDVRCNITDARLREISGLAAVGSAVFAINDKAPALIYRLDNRCRVVSTFTLGQVPVQDTEDLALGPDGSLWVGDIGGNHYMRTSVNLYRRMPRGGVYRYQLSYPDGAHDAEAMFVSKLGQVVIVTKQCDGVSRIYLAQLPLPSHAMLSLIGYLDVRSLRPKHGSLCITGAAAAPDGDHFVLRTYTTAFEWDSPDGDVVSALRSQRPRVINLAETRQGEAITYASEGNALITATERLPAPMHRVVIVRR